MDSLSTLIYNKTLLISKWEKTGILEYLDDYSDYERFKHVVYYEKLARHLIKVHDIDTANWAVGCKSVIDDKKYIKDKVSNIIIPIVYRDLRTKKYAFFFNISDLYDDVVEFVEDNIKSFKKANDLAGFYYPTDVESDLISVYSETFKDRMINKHFRFKRLLTEKEI